MSAHHDQAVTPAHRLRLVVAGRTLRSRRAIENLRRICENDLARKVNLEVIDIYQQPDLADTCQVMAAPTLVKLLPPPIRRMIGDLSERDRVLHGLEIAISPRLNGHAG